MKLIRLLSSICIFAMVIINLTSCMQQFGEVTGEEPVILDIQIVEDTCVYLKNDKTEKKLMEIQGDKEVVLQTFPANTSMEFHKQDASYYCLIQNKLIKCPVKDLEKKEICDVDISSIVCSTERYLLCNSPIDTLIDLETLTTKKIVPFQKTIVILDVYQNEIYYFDYSTHEMCSYNCDTDQHSLLYEYGKESNNYINRGKRVGELFYFVDDNDYLYKMSLYNGYDSERITTKEIVDICYTGKDIIAAVDENGSISFCKLDDENNITEFSRWDTVNYIVDGSCLIKTSEDRLIASVIYDTYIYDINIPENSD